MNTWSPSAIAILSIILIPVVPKLLRLRLKFLRWLHWDWAANLLENHFQAWVLFARIALFAIAVVTVLVAVRARTG